MQYETNSRKQIFCQTKLERAMFLRKLAVEILLVDLLQKLTRGDGMGSSKIGFTLSSHQVSQRVFEICERVNSYRFENGF